MREYDRKLWCECCILCSRCRGDIKHIMYSNHKFCPEFRDIKK